MAYATNLSLVYEVWNLYMLLTFCDHLRCGFRKITKRYELSVSPCTVPLWMGMGCVLLKCFPIIIMVDWEHKLPISAMALWV